MRKRGQKPSIDAKVKAAGVCILVAVCLFLRWVVMPGGSEFQDSGDNPQAVMRVSPSSKTLRVVTWNVAAINNNPFEYWISVDDPSYNALMQQVQRFVDTPEAQDVPVGEVFTAAMFDELEQLMLQQGWAGAEKMRERYTSDFEGRKIVSEFLKDRSLGSKRLTSMPDRVTNTIHTTSGVVYRPTVINCYRGDLGSVSEWWRQWKVFMFESEIVRAGSKDGSAKTPAEMLLPIKRAKYPALTEEEEQVSLPLQTLAEAIFDAILVHMLNTLAPDSWQGLRTKMCESLNLRKNERLLQILEESYMDDAEVIFMQEVATSFVIALESSPLSRVFFVASPAVLGKRDQNSVILLDRRFFLTDSVHEVTTLVEAQLPPKAPVATGDILALTVDAQSDRDGDSRPYLLASFHGDTNGLATIPVVSAVHAVHGSLSAAQSEGQGPLKMLFGLDANTYQHAKPGKTQDVLEFAHDFVSKGITSCWGDTPDPTQYTTFNARTFLQPQLQKAAREDEKKSRGDINPKDFILYYKGDFETKAVQKDNTGRKEYIEDMVFPTLDFPSDHGVLAVEMHML